MAPLDALLPPDMARRAEALRIAKASMDDLRVFTSAALAGAVIALGAVVATTALAGTGAGAWGALRAIPAGPSSASA
jgi:formate transporter